MMIFGFVLGVGILIGLALMHRPTPKPQKRVDARRIHELEYTLGFRDDAPGNEEWWSEARSDPSLIVQPSTARAARQQRVSARAAYLRRRLTAPDAPPPGAQEWWIEARADVRRQRGAAPADDLY
jgi:hypothetical protein